MGAHKGSRSRLTRRSLPLFTGDTLFDELARAVCRAECLPRKELYEAWEVARRARRRFRAGRVVDLAAGHGLLAYAMLLLADGEAVAVDVRRPPSAARLEAALLERWPRLRGRVRYDEGPLEELALGADDIVVSAHACGALSDRILDRALEVRASLALLPCCHALGKLDAGGLEGWMDGALAIDATRAARLRAADYRVWTQTIPEEITPKNRLLLGQPLSSRA